MSYDNRESAPQVFNYGGNNNNLGYSAGQNPPQNVNFNRPSNVEFNNVQKFPQVQPVVVNAPSTNVQRTSQFKGSRAD